MKYIVRLTYGYQTEYIAEGKNYCVNHEYYAPLTDKISEAKRYSTRTLAEKGANRNVCNLTGEIEIVEVIK